MYKNTQVLLLPSEKTPTKGELRFDHNGLGIEKEDICRIQGAKTFNIYIVTDEDIIDCKWFYSKNIGIHKKDQCCAECKKLISTTDKYVYLEREYESIHLGKGQLSFVNLPKISKTFINTFIGEYNKGYFIKDILVEFQTVNANHDTDLPHRMVDELKVNFDSTINIVWSKDESENDVLDFGRYILQLTNIVIKKHSRMQPLNEESGEKLLQDLYTKWKENK